MSRRKACYHSTRWPIPKALSALWRDLPARSRKRTNGFGDPLFIVSTHHKTFGQLNPSIKAEVSHRLGAEEIQTRIR
jgi:inosine/xanthosine triphosphate pyrophosphatase family protein